VGITLTPNWGSRPPFVDVLIEDIPEGVATFSVRRTVEGRTMDVRGLVKQVAVGGASQRDYEAPFFLDLTYAAEWFAADGSSIGFSEPVTTKLYGLSPGTAWFADPLDPENAVLVSFVQGAGSAISRETEGNQFDVPGRSVGFTLPGTRGGVKAVVLDCYTERRVDGQALDALFGGYDSDALSIICIRSRPEMWMPPTFFAFVGSPTKKPVAWDGQSLLWSIAGNEVAPPAPAFIKPLLTYQDFTDFYATYQQFTDSYPDYLTASRDYSIKGA